LRSELPYTLLKCRNYFSLFIFIVWTVFGSLYNLYNSSLYFILQTPFS
jgi:hypothetical protein